MKCILTFAVDCAGVDYADEIELETYVRDFCGFQYLDWDDDNQRVAVFSSVDEASAFCHSAWRRGGIVMFSATIHAELIQSVDAYKPYIS